MKTLLLIFLPLFASGIYAQQDSLSYNIEPFIGILVLDSTKPINKNPVALNYGPSFLQFTREKAVLHVRERKYTLSLVGKVTDLKVVSLPDSVITSCILIGEVENRGQRKYLEIIELLNHEIVLRVSWPPGSQNYLYYGHISSKEEEDYLREYFK